MNKKKRFLLTLLVMVLCVSFIFMAFACKDDLNEGENEEETSSDLLIQNGDFTKVESENFPKTPTGWSGSVGSSGGSTETPDGNDYLVSGVIDVSGKVYDKNKKLWGGITTPGAKGEDNNVLMIYNKKDTVYSYTVSGLALKQGKLYKLSVWAKSVSVDKNGIYIAVTGDAYGEFKAVNTNGDWTQYTSYIRASDIKDGSISLKLGLGQGNMNANPTTGYAFFDNVTFNEITTDDYANAAVTSATSFKYDCRLPDAEFDYSSGTYKPYSAVKYNGIRSKGANDEYADSDSTSVDKGILDLSEEKYTGVTDIANLKAAPGALGNKVLFLQNKKKTAYGYRASVPIRFTSNQYTEISIMVRTDLIDDKGYGAGAILKLTTGDENDDLNIKIEDINTGGEWKEFSFLIESNELRNRDLYLEMWLGQGGKDDSSKNTKGSAFFDTLSMKAIDKTLYDAATEIQGQLLKFSLKATPDDLLVDDKMTSSASWKDNKPADSNVITNGVAFTGTGNTSSWNVAGIENPGSPSTSLSSVFYMQNKQPTANQIVYNSSTNDASILNQGIFIVRPNNYYRLSLWVKTTDVDIAKGLGIALKKYDYTAADDAKDDKKWVSVATVDNINSKNFTTATDNANQNYVEVVFYLEGASIEALKAGAPQENKFKLELSLGNGNRVQADKLVSGNAFIANLRYENVTPSEFKGISTSNVTKSYSFYTSEDKSISNGGFNGIDVVTTNQNYDKLFAEGAEKPAAFDETGKLNNAFGAPKSWTFSNSDLLPNLYSGIYDSTVGALSNHLIANDPTIGSNFFAGLDGASDYQKRNVLTIGTRPASDNGYLIDRTSPEVCGCTCEACAKLGYCDGKSCTTTTECTCLHKNFSGAVKPLGYTSSNFTLAKDSYYIISLWVKSSTNASGSVTLSTGNKNEDQTISFNTGGNWQKVSFFVETGLSDASVKLNLYLGNKVDETTVVQGNVYFDWASFSTLSEKNYENLISNISINDKKVEYLEDGFNNADPSTDEALGTSKDWTLETVDSDAPKGTEDIMSGVFSPSTDDHSLLSNGKNEPLSVIDNIFATTLTNLNDKIFVINNKNATVQKAISKNSKSLAVDSYYKLSIWVLTYQVDQTKSATITLNLNNKTYTFGKDDDADGRKVNTSTGDALGEWTQYCYYIKTAPKTSISDVKLSFGLGAKGEDNYISGYLFADNVKTEKLTKDEFNAAVPVELTEGSEDENDVAKANYDLTKNYRIVFSEEDINAEPPVDDEGSSKLDPLLWLYITTGIIGGMLIIAIIAVLFRKFYKPKKKVRVAPPTYNKNNTTDNKPKNNKKEFKD